MRDDLDFPNTGCECHTAACWDQPGVGGVPGAWMVAKVGDLKRLVTSMSRWEKALTTQRSLLAENSEGKFLRLSALCLGWLICGTGTV